MKFESITLKDAFTVKKLYSVHYFEYTKDFDFEGEQHDFWELVYIDKGESLVRAGDRWTKLRAGEIIFHKPNEFHTINGSGAVAANSVIVSFACDSDNMRFFEGRILSVGDSERALLSSIVSEAMGAFSNDLGRVRFEKLVRRKSADFGAEQMLRLSLESLLISFFRKGGVVSERLSGTANANMQRDNIENAIAFINENLDKNITFSDVARQVKMGSTSLKTAFRKRVGMGVVEYLRAARTERAKMLIREEAYNMTEIAELLGYGELSRFSRQFRHITGMSPTEYARSVKASLESEGE